MCVAAGSLGPTSFPSKFLCPSRNDGFHDGLEMGMLRAAFQDDWSEDESSSGVNWLSLSMLHEFFCV